MKCCHCDNLLVTTNPSLLYTLYAFYSHTISLKTHFVDSYFMSHLCTLLLLNDQLCIHCEMKQKCHHCARGPNICTQSTNHMVLISTNPRFLWSLETQCWCSVAETPPSPSSGFWDMISIPPLNSNFKQPMWLVVNSHLEKYSLFTRIFVFAGWHKHCVH